MLRQVAPEERESSHELARRLEEVTGMRRREPDRPRRRPGIGTAVGLTALALAVGMGVYMGADFVRYLKIKRM